MLTSAKIYKDRLLFICFFRANRRQRAAHISRERSGIGGSPLTISLAVDVSKKRENRCRELYISGYSVN